MSSTIQIFRTHLKVANGNLSAREIEVVKLIAQGEAVKNIAENLCLSIPTIDKIKQSIFKKTRFYSSPEIASWASRINLV